jgi:radical SAM superfamily enzyme YgiQ (UPF0313 family)
MKILLVTPGTPSSPVVPDLGAGYLASALRKHGHEVFFLDGLKEKVVPGRMVRFCGENGISAIGLKIFSCFLADAVAAARALRAGLGNAILFAGGPHPSCDPQGTLGLIPELDFAVAGEAEETLPSAIGAFPFASEPRAIPNLVFRSGGKIVQNPRRPVEDIDSLAWPAWDLIDPRSYPPAPQGLLLKNHPAARMLASRGCPFDCKFCSVRLINGRAIRSRDPSDIAEEIGFLREKFGVREIHFSDDNFTASRDFCLSVCEKISGLPFRISWAVPQGIRLDTLDPGLLAAMKRSGCFAVGIGVESGSQGILERMGKKESLELIREKTSLVRASGIRSLGYFIVGYPGETEEDVGRTIAFSRSLPLDSAAFSVFRPFPGTAVWDELKAEGRLGAADQRMGDYDTPGWAAPPFTPALLARLKRKALTGFYSRPGAVRNFIKGIDLVRQAPWLLRRILKTFGRPRPSSSPRGSSP